MKDKIKIVWLCTISNPQIRQHLTFEKSTPLSFLKKLQRKSDQTDKAIWNTNGIKEFEQFEDTELHIISFHDGIKHSIQEFQINNIFYHILKDEDDTFIGKVKKKLKYNKSLQYIKNRKIIKETIEKINPDIINLIGAENPHYSTGILDLDKNIPIYLTLQTLMSQPNFKKNYPISDATYNYRTFYEKEVIKRANYLGSRSLINAQFIKKEIYPQIPVLKTGIALGEEIFKEKTTREYDFVYNALDISKAGDHAIEAFALVHKKYPNTTLYLVGGYSQETKRNLDLKIKESDIQNAVIFSGKLQNHTEVINEIRKARFSILPFKVDILPTTLREAMANGLPVVSVETYKTIELNNKRESILLSEIGNIQGLADNMEKLLINDDYANMIKCNAFQTCEEMYNNYKSMRNLVEAYKAAIDHFNNDTPIPEELLLL